MESDEIQRMIATLLQEEEALSDTIKKADIRLTQVRAARAALMALESEQPPEFDGNLADACRMILKNNAGRSMSAMEVRDHLKAIGYDTSKHEKNLIATVHSVLKRLAESKAEPKEVDSKTAKDGSGTRYFWVTAPEISNKFVGLMGVGLAAERARMADLSGSYAGILKQIAEGPLAQTMKTLEEFQRTHPMAELQKSLAEISGKMNVDPSHSKKK